MPLICEYSFSNVTISSSYWNGSQGNISDCHSKNTSFHFTSLRFPNRQIDDAMESLTSYIELPKDINKTPFKAAGVFIAASDLIQLLLPGSDNMQVLSYTLLIPSYINVFLKKHLVNGSTPKKLIVHLSSTHYTIPRRTRFMKKLNYQMIHMFSSFSNMRYMQNTLPIALFVETQTTKVKKAQLWILQCALIWRQMTILIIAVGSGKIKDVELYR